MRIKRVIINKELMKEWLCLPGDVEIVSGEIELILDSKRFPEIENGTVLEPQEIVLQKESVKLLSIGDVSFQENPNCVRSRGIR